MVPEGAYLQNLVVQVVLSFKDTNDSTNWQNVIGTTRPSQVQITFHRFSRFTKETMNQYPGPRGFSLREVFVKKNFKRKLWDQCNEPDESSRKRTRNARGRICSE